MNSGRVPPGGRQESTWDKPCWVTLQNGVKLPGRSQMIDVKRGVGEAQQIEIMVGVAG